MGKNKPHTVDHRANGACTCSVLLALRTGVCRYTGYLGGSPQKKWQLTSMSIMKKEKGCCVCGTCKLVRWL